MKEAQEEPVDVTDSLFNLQQNLCEAVGLDISKSGHGIRAFQLKVHAFEYPQLKVWKEINPQPPGAERIKAVKAKFRLVPEKDFKKVEHLLTQSSV